MTEAERITLYNDLCDYEQDLRAIMYPPQTKAIDTIHRAIAFVRGNKADWIRSGGTHVYDDLGNLIRTDFCTCSSCGFTRGSSDFKYCPYCASKMK